MYIDGIIEVNNIDGYDVVLKASKNEVKVNNYGYYEVKKTNLNNPLAFILIIFFFSCSITEPEDCAGVSNGQAYIDGCGICAEGTTGLNANYLMDCNGICNGNASGIDCGPTMLIYYNSIVDISGFQFNVTGVTLKGAEGGGGGDNNFTLTTSTTMVLGFSFEGDKIPAGTGLLTILSFEGTIENVCLENLILTDSNASILNAQIINCNTIQYGNG